ncbi:MAG TPA: response regulator [Bryobacteraceae bacterium]|nr:response regulator [Bryobacteraceae bacterium]
MTLAPEAMTFRILLVEDNAADSYLFRQALEIIGLSFELAVIQDGDEALAFAQSSPKHSATGIPDLLVLDLNLPKVAGCRILEAVRQNPDLAQVAVAIMTSSEAPQDHERCTALGISAYIVKPLDLEDFLRIGEMVKKILAESKDP